jgi:predicted Zn-dependent protease
MNMRLTIRNIIMRPLLLSAAVIALASCETVQTTQGGVVGVERQQRMAISEEQIEQAARQQYGELMAEEQKKGHLNRNPAQLAHVRAVANRLIPQTAVFRPDAQKWNWEVNTITSPEVNAWCMPGGKIAVYTGLLEKLQLTDDELAAVLGHEMAHALREHARERASEQVGADILASGAELLGSLYGIEGAGKIANVGLQLGMELPHSRVQETEADRIGVELAARAGYDPRAAVTLWQKMGQAGGGAPIKFLSTHPSREDRLSDLTVYSQRVMPLYEQAKKGR